jgi:hypothetical protein
MSEHHREHHEMGAASGLTASAGGYALKIAWIPSGDHLEGRLDFWILDRDGRAVGNFDEQHEKRMHLIVVRHDLSHYQHLHPSMSADGTWSIPLILPEPGVYRLFADFAIEGEPLTLGTDLDTPGHYEPRQLPDPAGVALVDGYEVVLDAGTVATGAETELTFRVTRKGLEVSDLDPYLGALGHLVALHEGDLAYLHVHPMGGAGSRIMFHTAFPSAGRYRLFLQFAHRGQVHTVAFTLEVPS